VNVVGDRAQLLDTRTVTPRGTKMGPTDPEQEITVTVMVKSKASVAEMDKCLQEIQEGKRKPLTDKEFTAQFGADSTAMSNVLKFAKDNSLNTAKADAESGQVKLTGKVKDFQKAFGVQLDDYQNGPIVSRGRTGDISVPRALSNDIQGVFGLDNSELAKPHFKKLDNADPRASGSFMPQEVADLYHFPKESMGNGQSVAIVELGGGLVLDDNAKYYSDNGLPQPKNIQIVGVDGADNKPGADADGEVALDTQIIGAVAPEANQQLIFAPNSEQGFVDAITRATFPEKGEMQNSAISISWGAPESGWTDQAIQNMDIAFKKAALKGISTFAASGDNGAKDGTSAYTADFPSSDPYVTGTGGTRLDHSGKEVTWNDGSFGGSTGGGISSKFDVPDFQKGINLPANANKDGKVGRGDPDVAGDASPNSGYVIRYNGSETVTGGTSAVAPLYAALMMRVNGALGRPAGYLNPFLYKNGNSGIFKDITSGNNNGYSAGPGWDAATGWGSIRGDKFLEALRNQKQA
jgi:kumamolisin